MRHTVMHKFRVKHTKTSEATHILPKNQDQNNSKIQAYRHGFSSDYLNLANKFNANILNISSTQRHYSSEKGRLSRNSKVGRLRLQTELSQQPARYGWLSPSHNLEKKSGKQIAGIDSQRDHRSNNTIISGKHRNMLFRQSLMKWGVENEKPFRMRLQTPDMLMRVASHSFKLLSLKNALDKQDERQSIKLIKSYILGDEHSIAKLDKSFSEYQASKNIKKLLMFQRIIIVAIAHNIICNRMLHLWEELSRTLEMVVGFWYQIMSNTYQHNVFKLQIEIRSGIGELIKAHADARLLTKPHLPELLNALSQKIPFLFQYYRTLYQKITPLLTLSPTASINKSFYDLLAIFATYLTQLEAKITLNHPAFSFFATCPSPYLLKPSPKKYSLIVDLDETLLYSLHHEDKHYETFYRPHSQEFLSDLSTHYEIIVFTTSLEHYARDVTARFAGIDGMLFRQHAVRLRYGLVKDLGRIGRDLSRTVIVDDLRGNFRLQKENGVCVGSWKGEPGDEQLLKVKELLLGVAKSGKDVRVSLKQLKDKYLSIDKMESGTKTLSFLSLKPIEQCKFESIGEEQSRAQNKIQLQGQNKVQSNQIQHRIQKQYKLQGQNRKQDLLHQ